MAKHTQQKDIGNEMPFTALNYKLLVAGIAIIILGFILMSGGGSGDPNVFNEHEIFSPMRITVAPIITLVGYVFIIFAIMKRSGDEEVGS